MTPEVEAEFVEAVKWLDAKGVEVSERLHSRLVWRAARRGGRDAPLPRAVWRGRGWGGGRRRPRAAAGPQRASVVESFH